VEVIIAAAKLIAITDPTFVSAARREALAFSNAAGFNEVNSGKLATIVTEAATNVLKHASSGSIVVGPVQTRRRGVYVLALDNGKGITQLDRSFDDGFSTAGSPGTGLGAIRRMASGFDIYSGADKGTALLASVGEQEETVGSIAVALAGEQHSGDNCEVVVGNRRTLLLVVDGLGHGIFANEAAEEATRTFEENAAYSPAEIMHRIHDALRKTRGAAAAIAEIDYETNLVRFCGIGNISGAIASASSKVRNMVSYNGTLGHQLAKVQEFTYPIHDQELVVMHSDGISANWDLSKFPGLAGRHPLVIAGMILRDHRRQRDDASIMVMRYQKQAA
jgi:anti-sigma regulatory factor (Ser/Thr protein kinase)